jgi:hypothetical protein
MKKFLFIITCSLCVIFASAQSTLPRWGGGPPQNDNTGRVLTYELKTVTTTTATSTAVQKPNAFQTIIKVGTLQRALTDSLSIANAYVGDEAIFVFTADTLTAGRVVTFNSNSLKSAGTLTVPKSKKATASFIFDGTLWIEKSRALMAN